MITKPPKCFIDRLGTDYENYDNTVLFIWQLENGATVEVYKTKNNWVEAWFDSSYRIHREGGPAQSYFEKVGRNWIRKSCTFREYGGRPLRPEEALKKVTDINLKKELLLLL